MQGQKRIRRNTRIRNKKSLTDRLASWVWLLCAEVGSFVGSESKHVVGVFRPSGKRQNKRIPQARVIERVEVPAANHLDLSMDKEEVKETVKEDSPQEHYHLEVQTMYKAPQVIKQHAAPSVKVVRGAVVWEGISKMIRRVGGGLKHKMVQSRILLLKHSAGVYKKMHGVTVFETPNLIPQGQLGFDTGRAGVWVGGALSFITGGVLLGWNYLVGSIEYITEKVIGLLPKRHKIPKTPVVKQVVPEVVPNQTPEHTKQGVTVKQMIKQKIPKKPKRNTAAKASGFWLWRWCKNAVLAGVVLGFVGAGVFVIWVATLEIPETNFDDLIQSQSTKLFDSTGEVLLHDVYGEERRTVVSLDQISENMQKAILATEDDEFYSHGGYDVSAILRGVCYEVSRVVKAPTFGGTCPRGGGSTITQQVIKNTLLNADRKIERKVKEVVLARKLEKQKTKDEILEIYLNEIAFGGPIYGVEQASLSLFGKNAKDLTIAESAYLAALPKAPTTYLNDRERFDGRQQFIIGRMKSQSFITDSEYKNAIREEVEFRERVDKGIKAPHFVFYVLDEIDKKLSTDEEALNLGGYRIQTTLNWELQQELEAVVTKQAERIGSQYKASNLAVVAIENKTGKIRAMVGSKDYFAEDIDGKFNIATALRQPGSTFKPFVYANAFSKGYLPQTVLWDTATEFSTSCYPDGTPQLPQYADRCYSPQNYDKSFRGPISMRHALAQSLNIPAVKALYLVGVGDSMKLARKLGITSLTRSPNFYGLNLVLGGGEVRLVEMANAYGVFANGGQRKALASWESIVDAEREVVDQYEEVSEQVLSANVAAMINDVLSDDDAKRPVFGASSRLYYGSRDVAVKTGTTNNFKDVWTVGYSSDVTIAVWAGNNDNTPLARAPSSSVVGPFWREAMDVALKYYDAKPFAGYSAGNTAGIAGILTGDYVGGSVAYVDPNTGETVTNPTTEELEAGLYDQVGTRSYNSILYHVNKSNPRGGAASRGDSLYDHFEYGVRNWVEAEGLVREVSTTTINSLIDEINQIQGIDVRDGDNVETDSAEAGFGFSITSPVSGTVVDASERVTVAIETVGDATEIETIYYYLNNSFLESGSFRTTSVRVTPSSIRDLAEQNTVKVIVQKTDGTRIEKTVLLNVE